LPIAILAENVSPIPRVILALKSIDQYWWRYSKSIADTIDSDTFIAILTTLTKLTEASQTVISHTYAIVMCCFSSMSAASPMKPHYVQNTLAMF